MTPVSVAAVSSVQTASSTSYQLQRVSGGASASDMTTAQSTEYRLVRDSLAQ